MRVLVYSGVQMGLARFVTASTTTPLPLPQVMLKPNRLGLHERERSAAMRRVQPLQLREVDPSMYHRASYSMLGLESEAKLQTRMICLFVCCFSVPVP